MTDPLSFTRVAGDDWTIILTLGGTGALTGTFACHARTAVEDDTPAFTLSVAIRDADDRQVVATGARADTAGIDPGTYVIDVANIDADDKRTTFGAGETVLVVKQGSTR